MNADTFDWYEEDSDGVSHGQAGQPYIRPTHHEDGGRWTSTADVYGTFESFLDTETPAQRRRRNGLA